jgi:cobyrinic acid a,c-diamide synthase
MEEALDLERIVALAREAPAIAVEIPPIPALPPADVRIAIARDSAFGFYYAGDLDALRAAGAELVFFDAMRDAALPAVDGLFIGGGFPETHLPELAANESLREGIRQAIDGGLPAYVECGGLMYMTRRISWQGETARMVGAIAADVVVHEKPRGHGYVRLRETKAAPWAAAAGGGSGSADIPAHEFHYSDLCNLEGEPIFAYDVLRGHGIDGRHDGWIYRNLLASYAHLRHTAGNPWARRFVDFVRLCKTR